MFNFGFGGMGGMGGGGGRAPRREVNNTKFYEDLEVSKTADADEIRKAFRRKAMVHHPDKGGDPEKFKEIQKAYEILSDKDKRAIYDEGGEEALEGGGGGGHDMSDMFDMFGGGGGRRRGPAQKRRGEDVVFPLQLSLEEMYTGVSKKLRLTRNILCKACDGKGGKNVKQCGPCRGQGVRMAIRQVGPGMITQSQVTCSNCQGQGQVIEAADRCGTCHGDKTVKEKKNLDVYVPRGAKHGQRATFQGEADQAPDTVPGDVVVVMQQKEHAVFHRKGRHLFVKREISLIEALTGFKMTIQHLDGRTLVLEHAGVTRPGEYKKVADEGMQMQGHHANGNLYVEISIVFPTKPLDAAAGAELRRLMPTQPKDNGGRPIPAESDTVECVDAVAANMDKEQQLFEREREMEEEAEEQEREMRGEGRGHRHGGGAPQCQQV